MEGTCMLQGRKQTRQPFNYTKVEIMIAMVTMNGDIMGLFNQIARRPELELH
jgi:hypothetical protein